MKTIATRLSTLKCRFTAQATKLVALPLLLLVPVLFGSGCAHSLEVKNLNSYRSNSIGTLERPTTIGVVQTTEGADCQQVVKGIAQALGKNSAKVYLPYSPSRDKQVDVIANIKVNPKYAGSGWNFLINWPGFLIWTPAWNGYVYKADFNVDVALTRGADNAPIDTWTTPIKLDLRHAEFDRTWTEIGWLEYGVIPLIGGLVFINYDSDVTPILMDTIEAPIGEYLALDIIKHINDKYTPATPAPAPAATTAAPASQ